MDHTVITARELAAWLKVKLPTVRRWQSQEDLPCLRVGRLVRYEADRVREWLEHRQTTDRRKRTEHKPGRGPATKEEESGDNDTNRRQAPRDARPA